MSERVCAECGEMNAGLGVRCRVCGATLDDERVERPARLVRAARNAALRTPTAGATTDVDGVIKAANRSLDFALYGLVGFGLIFGLAAVLKGYAARSALAVANVDRGVIARANWAIAIGLFDMLLAPGLGFLVIGGLIYLWMS